MKAHPLLLIILLCVFIIPISTHAGDRADEIRKEMWQTSDRDFHVVETPQKWANKSAVIIAKLHRFEYRKSLIAATLQDKQFHHYRIKLLDQNAVNKYAELNYPANRTGYNVYTGFKVVKPNGQEIIVDQKDAVKMERTKSRYNEAYFKIAIPNLEVGDIIDYYICHEEEKRVYAYVMFFEPFIYNLPHEYPLMKQKLQFKVQRKCYINLKSVNGAPTLKMVTDKENDEQYYSLEDGDRDGIADVKWLYPNREVPTVKFRASFATGSELLRQNTFLGRQGEVKSNITTQEILNVTNSIFRPHIVKPCLTYLKKNHKGEKDSFKVSEAAYNFYRNELLNISQIRTLNGADDYAFTPSEFIGKFSLVLKNQNIPFDVIVFASRSISSLEDIILENELEFMIRVKKRSEYMYFANPSIHRVAGSIPSLAQNTEAYAVDGLLSPSKRIAKKITIPATTAQDNCVRTTSIVRIKDLASAEVSTEIQFTGVGKIQAQHAFLDPFDAIDEDKSKRYPEPDMKELNITKQYVKRYEAAKQAYLNEKDNKRSTEFKAYATGNFDFAINEVSNVNIRETGRYNTSPAMIMTYDYTSDDLIKRTGPNHLLEIGKLIESQIKIDREELDRNFSIYMDYPRSFKHTIILEVPSGYQAVGLDNFNQKVETSTGGFISTAREDERKIIIETHKYYSNYNYPREQWLELVRFLNAAHDFSEQKILLKKTTAL